MKKSLIKGALFSSFILLVPLNVQAADATDTGSSGETTAQITFTAGRTDTIKPVDPNDPSVAANPSPTNGVISHGPITGPSFIYVTPQMTFGVGNSSINFYQNQKYTATVSQVQSETKPGDSVNNPFDSNFVVEIADGRGAAAKWNVNVSGSPLTVYNDAVKDTVKDVAKNASITWPEADVRNSGVSKNNVKIKAKKIDEKEPLYLDNTGKTILDASEPGVGAGITTAQFNPNDIKLNIPVNSVKPQTYSTTLSWTLSKEALS